MAPILKIVHNLSFTMKFQTKTTPEQPHINSYRTQVNDVAAERLAHAPGACCTGTVTVEAQGAAGACPDDKTIRTATASWLRSSMRRLRHLRMPSDAAADQEPHEEDVGPPEERVENQVRPVSAPSALGAAGDARGAARTRSGRSSASSRRPRSLSSSVSSFASSVDSSPSCTPVSTATRPVAQEQQNGTANLRRLVFFSIFLTSSFCF